LESEKNPIHKPSGEKKGAAAEVPSVPERTADFDVLSERRERRVRPSDPFVTNAVRRPSLEIAIEGPKAAETTSSPASSANRKNG
jgi:hypothetical protein